MKTGINVQVDDSKTKRRNILTSARSCAEQLRDFNSIKQLRVKKREKLQKLTNIVSDIWVALDELNIKDVPSVHIMDQEVHDDKKTEVKESERKAIKPVEAPIKMDKREQQLTRELEDIDRKLAAL